MNRFLPTARPSRPSWHAFARALRVVASCLLLVTCSSDSPLSPGIPIRGEMSLAALFRAGGQVPIPVDTVLVELRRTSDSSVAFSELVPASRFSQQNDSLVIPITLELRQTTEQFHLYAEARGGGIVYYTVRSTVTATAGQSTPTPSLAPVYVGPGSTADSVVLNLSAPGTAPGDSVLAVASVYDNGVVVPGVPVGIATSDSTTVFPRAQGVGDAWLVAGPAAGSVSVIATTPTGLTDTVGFVVSITPVPSSLVKVSGDNQVVAAGVAAQPVVVQVRDQQGQPVAGFPVSFTLVTSPAGTTLVPTATTTDAAGLAQATVTAGQVAGAVTVQASAAGLAGSPQVFTLTVTVPLTGPATVAAQSAASQAGTAGQAVAAPPSVVVRDSNDVLLPGVPVTFAVGTGNGTVTGGAQVTNASGIATVTSWTLDATPGSDTLTATVAGLAPVLFTATSSSGLPASVVLISGDAQSGPAGAALALPLVVEVRDALGNPVTGAMVAWATPDGGSLAPTSGPTGANGQAQATWTLGPSAPSQSATATVGTLPAVSFAATATFGPPVISLSYPGLPNVGLGKSVAVRATIPTGAPAGGVQVTLTSDQPAVAQVAAPAAVTIPQGGTFADFTVNGVALGATTLRGNATGYTEGTLPIAVEDRSISVPATLNVPYAGTQSLPIVIGSPAPAGGVVVAVSSDNPATVGVVTPSVTIPAGATSANATVSGVLPGTANVTVDNPAYSSDVSLVTTSASLNVVQTVASLNASFGTTIDLRFESNGVPIAAPAGGIAVTLTPRNTACVTAPGATIPAGQVTVSTPLTAGTAPLPCTTYVVATAPNLAPDSVQVTVNLMPDISLSTPASTIGAGLQVGQSGSLGASNHPGVTIRLTSVDSSLVLLAPNASTAGAGTLDLPIVAGNSFFSFTVQGIAGQFGTAQVVATAPGFNPDTITITTVQPALDIIFLTASTTTFSPNSGFQVRLGIPNGQLTAIAAEQAVAASASPVSVTLANDSAFVGQLVTSALTGQVVTVAVAPAQSRSPGSVATGGVEFDPVGAGVTFLRATAPGFIVLPSATGTVTVSAPLIAVSQPQNPGAGLQVSTSGNLGATNHGGITLRITSSDPARLLVAPNGSTAGSAFIDIPLLNGNSFFSFAVQGLEGQAGAVDITASAPGFVPDTVTVSVVTPAYDVIFLPANTTSLSPNSGFQIRLGIPNGQLTGMAAEQVLRAGSPGVTVTVAHSAPAVGQLVTQAATGDTVTTTISAENSRSPGSVATGGLEYDPLTPGVDSVTASIPGFVVLPTSTQQITVTGQGINLSQPGDVGSGLVTGTSGNLGASNHGGVTVRLTSLDSAKVRLAPNTTTAATGTLDIPLANGSTFFSYTVHGLEGQTGPVAIVATAAGFTPDTVTVNVVAPAVDIIFLPTSLTTFSPNSGFQARVGIPNGQLTAMAVEQAIRFGGTPLAVSLTSSTPAVAALVSQAGSGPTADITIAAGQSRSPGSVATGGVEVDPILGGSTTISAVAPPFLALPTASVTVTVTSPTISMGSVTVGDGLQAGSSGSLGASNHGGVTVRVQSSDSTIALVAPNSSTPGTGFIDIPLANGVSFFSFVVQGVEGQAGVPVISATASGFTDGSGTATVVPAAIDVIFLPTNTTTLSPAAGFNVRVGIPNGQNTAMAAEQPVRAGGIPITATVSNSAAGVATLQFQGGPAQAGTVTIGTGQSRSPGGAAQGGVEFLATGVGTTTVSATTTNYIVLPTASQSVNVATPGISTGQVTVGAGLQVGSSASLGASNHGGVTVRVTSANPSLYLISPNTTTAGSAFVDFPLANGNTFVSYVVQGVDGAAGTASVTVSATGYTDGTASNTVVQPSADIIFLPSTIAAGAVNDDFQVRIGIPDGLGNALSQEQARAFGLAPLTATVTNANATVAQLTTSLGTGQSAQVTVDPNTSRSPSTLATGGVQFDPLAAGSTSVSVSIPGFRVLPASTFAVTVQ